VLKLWQTGALCNRLLKEEGKGKHNSSTTKEKPTPEKKTPTYEPQKDYFLVIALSGSISDSDVWLIDIGASGHMNGSWNLLSKVSRKHASLQVELGDNAKYEVKGVSSVSFQLDPDDTFHLGKVLLVPGLKKNLIYVSSLEDKGMRNSFVDGKALMWSKDSSIDSATIIGTQSYIHWYPNWSVEIVSDLFHSPDKYLVMLFSLALSL